MHKLKYVSKIIKIFNENVFHLTVKSVPQARCSYSNPTDNKNLNFFIFSLVIRNGIL